MDFSRIWPSGKERFGEFGLGALTGVMFGLQNLYVQSFVEFKKVAQVHVFSLEREEPVHEHQQRLLEQFGTLDKLNKHCFQVYLLERGGFEASLDNLSHDFRHSRIYFLLFQSQRT